MDLYFYFRTQTLNMLHTYLSLFCGHKCFKENKNKNKNKSKYIGINKFVIKNINKLNVI